MIMDKISVVMLRMHTQLIPQTYSNLKWNSEDIDHLVCHQVGKKPHQRMIKLAGVEARCASVTYQHYGNITSATIPFNLHLIRPKMGEKVLLLGAGSGLSISQVGLTF